MTRLKYILIFLLITSFAFAQEVNQKYSYKDFTNITFIDKSASDFNNTIIKGSCFYQENKPDSHIFPEDIKGVIFEKCNLDNVYIPLGNTIIDCCHRKIKIQNDLEDWILDNDLKPKTPIRKSDYERLDISTKPENIPVSKKEISVIREKEELNEASRINN